MGILSVLPRLIMLLSTHPPRWNHSRYYCAYRICCDLTTIFGGEYIQKVSAILDFVHNFCKFCPVAWILPTWTSKGLFGVCDIIRGWECHQGFGIDFPNKQRSIVRYPLVLLTLRAIAKHSHRPYDTLTPVLHVIWSPSPPTNKVLQAWVLDLAL